MMTAVDTNILLDVLLQDPAFVESSEKALRQTSSEGALVICEVVYAELAGLFPTHPSLETFLRDTGIRTIHSKSETLWKAGELWRHFCLERKSKEEAGRRILADFFIGAHALLQAERLLTRDQGFYQSVFQGLQLV